MAPARQPLEPIVIGADIGNATTSIARADGTAAFFPSVLTTHALGAYDGMPISGTSRHHIDYETRDGTLHAVVGADALEMNGAETILNETAAAHVRYTEDVSLLCFLAGVSAAFPEASTVAVRLATGAPISLFEAHGAEIAQRYQGEHRYRYNGRERRVVVEGVQVLGEGREAWRLLTAEQRRGNVAIHDVGGKTWNVLLFKDGALKAARTFDYGTERLLDAVPLAPKGPIERWALQTDLRRNPKAQQAVRAQIERAISAALDVIDRKVALPQAHRHALIGGGAIYVAPLLKRRYSAPTVTLNGEAPESANAVAYAMAMAGEAL